MNFILCLMSFFLCSIVKMIYKDSITSLYVVYRLDKCVNNIINDSKHRALHVQCHWVVSSRGRTVSVCDTVLHYTAARLWRE